MILSISPHKRHQETSRCGAAAQRVGRKERSLAKGAKLAKGRVEKKIDRHAAAYLCEAAAHPRCGVSG